MERRKVRSLRRSGVVLVILWGDGEAFAHEDGYIVGGFSGWVEVAVDAPDFEAVAQIELDVGEVGVARFDLKCPAFLFTRPVGGTPEQERTNV